MIGCISPADNNYDETLSTVRYANRAKNICNKPRINQDPKDALLSEYQKEIQELKLLLERQQKSGENNKNCLLSPQDIPNAGIMGAGIYKKQNSMH